MTNVYYAVVNSTSCIKKEERNYENGLINVTFGNATPCATSHRTQQRPHHVTLEIQVLTWDMNKDVGRLFLCVFGMS
jgi:hypothetical protein